jgi:glycerophosphoryl diester phosphodiesterase
MWPLHRHLPARILATLLLGPALGAQAFDLQGHRGARGTAPENTLPGFAAALAVGVATLELDTGITRDGIVVIHHDRRLNPDIARDPDGRWIKAPGALLRALDFGELQRYDVGRLRPGSEYAARFPDQSPADGVRIPRLAALFELVRKAGNTQVRFNIETKISPADGCVEVGHELRPRRQAGDVVDPAKPKGGLLAGPGERAQAVEQLDLIVGGA